VIEFRRGRERGRPAGRAGPAGPPGRAGGLASLGEPVRRRLYEYVSEQDQPVSREQAAAAAGIGRALAAYHLDKLAEAGLLETAYQRPAGRGGPGGGRPAKLYRPSGRELSVSVPPREYELLARLLAEAAETDTSGKVRAALNEVAYELGRRLNVAEDGDLAAVLDANGYQPRVNAEGVLELRNCPFHRLAQEHRDLVCSLNLCLVRGVIAGSRCKGARAVLSPRPGRCCVVVHDDSRLSRVTHRGQPDTARMSGRGPDHRPHAHEVPDSPR
jgi:predicted ArsR family transcriptional regulator